MSFSYDQDKLLTGAGAESIARDPNNGLVTNTATASVSDAWTYNAFGEPASYTASFNGTPLMSEQWTRDDAGRITQKSETIGGVTSIYTYGYDTAGRLTAVTTNGTVSASYTYDENSNRLTKNSEAGTYDAQDRMLTYNGASYSYTANGELQSRTDATGTTTYNYDELGNLLSVTKPDGTLIEYAIDAQNRRVGKKVNGTLVMELVYSDSLRPAAEIDANGNVVERFIYGSRTNVPDLIVKGDVTYRVISDHLGSPRLIVNTTDGTIAERMDYDEFGIVTSDTNPGFQPFGFAGGLYDADTNLIRFGARDYDPATGRWTTKDPFLFDGGDTNLYGYVVSDPINALDPSGLTLRSNWDFFWDWFFGSGASVRSYGPNAPETEEMQRSAGAERMRQAFYSHNCRSVTASYSTTRAYWDTIANPFTRDLSSTAAQVGGFAGATVVNNGNGTATFNIPNIAGLHSFSYHLLPNRSSGMMSNIYQNFTWTEPISRGCGCQ